MYMYIVYSTLSIIVDIILSGYTVAGEGIDIIAYVHTCCLRWASSRDVLSLAFLCSSTTLCLATRCLRYSLSCVCVCVRWERERERPVTGWCVVVIPQSGCFFSEWSWWTHCVQSSTLESSVGRWVTVLDSVKLVHVHAHAFTLLHSVKSKSHCSMLRPAAIVIPLVNPRRMHSEGYSTMYMYLLAEVAGPPTPKLTEISPLGEADYY